MMRILLLLVAVWLLPSSPQPEAHEIRPAGLYLREREDGTVYIRWRQPAGGEYRLAIAPELSSGWLEREPDHRYTTTDSLVMEWTVAQPRMDLEGQRLNISGLNQTITDVFTEIEFPDGSRQTHLIKPARPFLEISRGGQGGRESSGYFLLGLTHISTGVDHLAYLLGLVLLIGNLVILMKTITAFTVAHSITLACSTLGLFTLKPAAVEAMIALSIVYVAAEVVRKHRHQGKLLLRFPWQAAFVFGLLHGFGFAGALASTGLPGSNLPQALLFFNLGIEAGQLIFLLSLLGVLLLLDFTVPWLCCQFHRMIPYLIGSVASYWVLDRVLA